MTAEEELKRLKALLASMKYEEGGYGKRIVFDGRTHYYAFTFARQLKELFDVALEAKP